MHSALKRHSYVSLSSYGDVGHLHYRANNCLVITKADIWIPLRPNETGEILELMLVWQLCPDLFDGMKSVVVQCFR